MMGTEQATPPPPTRAVRDRHRPAVANPDEAQTPEIVRRTDVSAVPLVFPGGLAEPPGRRRASKAELVAGLQESAAGREDLWLVNDTHDYAPLAASLPESLRVPLLWPSCAPRTALR